MPKWYGLQGLIIIISYRTCAADKRAALSPVVSSLLLAAPPLHAPSSACGSFCCSGV
jgi:hypothetical protein